MASAKAKIRHVFGDTFSCRAAPPDILVELSGIDQLQNLVTKPLRNIETRLIMQNESFIDFLARKLK